MPVDPRILAALAAPLRSGGNVVRSPKRPGGYAATPGSGPAAETCRSCANCYSVQGGARRFYKCTLTRFTKGAGSDVLVGSTRLRPLGARIAVTKRAAPPGQLGFSFEQRAPLSGPAAFAGVEARASAEVSRLLKADPRTREEVAGALSAAMSEDVSRWMLDAYASPGRDGHNISFGRALALMGVTGDRAMMEWAIAQLGGTVLWGEEIVVARIGQLEARKRQIETELKAIKATAQPIRREGRQ